MPTNLITLPCTARELEAALHSYCDHYGAWDMNVGVLTATRADMPDRICIALTLSRAPSVTAASETTNPNNKE